MANRKTERTYENIICILFITVFSYLLRVAYTAKSFKVNGMKSFTFPKGILTILIVLCLFKLILNIVEIIRLRGKENDKFEHLHPIKLLTLGMILVYAALWNVIGFGLSSILFITIESRLLRNSCSWLRAFIVALASTVFIYFVFGFLFNVSFPEPILDLIF